MQCVNRPRVKGSTTLYLLNLLAVKHKLADNENIDRESKNCKKIVFADNKLLPLMSCRFKRALTLAVIICCFTEFQV